MSPQSDQPRANSVRRLRLSPPNGFALFPLFCILVFLLHARLSRVSFEPSFFAVRIQHSLICQTVLSYSSANPSRVPYECFKVSKPHCQLLNSARCLQSEAVSKGCVEFVEAAEQRKRDRSCLHCTSAAVMFPPWTQQEELEHMGADSVSQPAGSLHKTAQICCFLLQEFPFLFLKLSFKLRNHQTNFS